jgi:hypothetical protein
MQAGTLANRLWYSLPLNSESATATVFSDKAVHAEIAVHVLLFLTDDRYFQLVIRDKTHNLFSK